MDDDDVLLPSSSQNTFPSFSGFVLMTHHKKSRGEVGTTQQIEQKRENTFAPLARDPTLGSLSSSL
eukprot:scaffold16671_cov99-Amphora_coffeaeformis.AAC.1